MSAAVLLALFAGTAPSPLPSLPRLAGRVAAWGAALGAGFIVSNNLVGKMADGQVHRWPVSCRATTSRSRPVA